MRPTSCALLLCLAGCSASHPIDDEVAVFVAALNQASCEREVRCESQAHEWSLGQCHTAVESQFVRGAIELEARGELAFDAGAAARCLDQLRALPCHGEDEIASTASCFDVFVARRAIGEPCTPSRGRSGCIESFCAATDACNGTCVPGGEPASTCSLRPCARTSCLFDGVAYCSGPAPGLGEPCEGGCDQTGEQTLACIAGVCVVVLVVEIGAACGPGVGLCGDDARCDRGVCRALRTTELGAPCSRSAFCVPELACVDGVCSARLAPGAPCTGDDCSDAARYCVHGVCSSTPEPDAPSCRGWQGPLVGARPCEGDLACSASRSRCSVVIPSGGACTPSEVCAEGNRCVDARCVAIALPGEPCGADTVCPHFLECREGTCRSLPSFGEACRDACFASVCIDGRCGTRPAGSACRSNVECDSLCRDGVCDPSPVLGEPCAISGRYYCPRGLVCVADANDVTRCVDPTCEP